MGFSIDQFRLDGKVAIVTGAGGRGNSIGRAYALGLSRAGAQVVVADIQAEGAQQVCDEIAAAGGSASDAVKLVGFVPFDPATKMSEATVQVPGGETQRVVKGAFAAIIGLAQSSPTAAEDVIAAPRHRR